MKSHFPSARAVMTRRILVNYRVRPEALQPLLPHPFRPKLISGWGLAGICLIRLQKIRPAFLPATFGMSSENAAHRIAVEWTEAGTTREGVFIPRRDTNSLLNRFAGGRIFPGVHHPATFRSYETEQQFKVELQSQDRQTVVRVAVRRTKNWPGGSLFDSLDQASEFFRRGCCGWSPGVNGNSLEGVELCTDQWKMHQLTIDHAESSFFTDPTRFGPGTVELDSALLMHDIPHAWRTINSRFEDKPGRKVHRHGPSSLFEMP